MRVELIWRRDSSRTDEALMLLPMALTVGLLAWSFVANLWLGDRGYLVRNVLLTVGLVVAALLLEYRPAALGLSVARADAGLAWGAVSALLVAVAVVVGVVLASRVRLFASLLADERASVPPAVLAYHTLVRIPIGTVAFEEVAFRGVLLATLAPVLSPVWAVVWSSLAFGVWHIAPTAVSLRVNHVPVESTPGARAVVGALVVTTVAGGAFAWLRLGSGSLLAPILAHWATNAVGLLAAARSHR